MCVAVDHDFAFETTLSGLSYLRKIKLWQKLGNQVKLWFLSLPSADLAGSYAAMIRAARAAEECDLLRVSKLCVDLVKTELSAQKVHTGFFITAVLRATCSDVWVAT